MKRYIQVSGIAVATALVLALAGSSSQAGRIGGPWSTSSMAPAGNSVYFNIPFAADPQPATVTINGDGRSIMHLLIYDTDGHVMIGTGTLFSKTASMNVYRAGVFRVEIRNVGLYDSNFTLTTN